jgi:hypothetical protein
MFAGYSSLTVATERALLLSFLRQERAAAAMRATLASAPITRPVTDSAFGNERGVGVPVGVAGEGVRFACGLKSGCWSGKGRYRMIGKPRWTTDDRPCSRFGADKRMEDGEVS